MKKFTSIFLSLVMIISLAACSQAPESPASSESSTTLNNSAVQTDSENKSSGNSTDSISDTSNSDSGFNTSSDKGGNTTSKPAEESKPTEATSPKILVAYFSYGENANLPDSVDASSSASIQILDGKITGNTGLVANYIQKATGGDIFSIRTVKTYSDDYNTVVDEGQAEKNNNEKPELSSHIDNLEDYNTVFIGFPNWWYGMPMVMYSFLDEYDFSGMTIVPFCTSGGSAFSDAIDEIKKAEPNATVLDGLHISGSSASRSESEVSEWVNGLSLAK